VADSFGGIIMVTLSFKIPNSLDRIFTAPVLLWRLFKYGYTFRKIHLGEGLYTIVEPQDYYWLNNYNWYLASNGKQYYAFRNAIVSPGKIKMLSMHRQIMQPELDAALRTQNTQRNNLRSKLLIDHINGDSLDNRRANLRIATPSQNAYNRPKIKSKTSSKYIGVYFEKATKRWTVKIRIGPGKRIWLGRFDNEITAARAYDKAAKKYHKEFARLNFPKDA
jgi:hypothetical protein